jgi:hypothetical protein
MHDGSNGQDWRPGFAVLAVLVWSRCPGLGAVAATSVVVFRAFHDMF